MYRYGIHKSRSGKIVKHIVKYVDEQQLNNEQEIHRYPNKLDGVIIIKELFEDITIDEVNIRLNKILKEYVDNKNITFVEKQYLYRYGIHKTNKGKISKHVVRHTDGSEKYKYPQKGRVLIIKEEINLLTSREATEKTKKMLDEYNLEKIHAGDVAHHSDEFGNHIAIVLRTTRNHALAIFFTSSPSFGKRKATIEELGCAGFGYSKNTYVAPVVRSKEDFTPNGINFPEYRVKELLKEFFNE